MPAPSAALFCGPSFFVANTHTYIYFLPTALFPGTKFLGMGTITALPSFFLSHKTNATPQQQQGFLTWPDAPPHTRSPTAAALPTHPTPPFTKTTTSPRVRFFYLCMYSYIYVFTCLLCFPPVVHLSAFWQKYTAVCTATIEHS